MEIITPDHIEILKRSGELEAFIMIDAFKINLSNKVGDMAELAKGDKITFVIDPKGVYFYKSDWGFHISSPHSARKLTVNSSGLVRLFQEKYKIKRKIKYPVKRSTTLNGKTLYEIVFTKQVQRKRPPKNLKNK